MDGVDGSSQTTRALLKLRELLFAGEFRPGQRVPEVPLSTRLGVSRTPLRLALATLAHEGLLETLPSGGFVVRAFTDADVDDAIELRGVLEGTAARLAAERGPSPQALADLERCVNEMDSLLDNPETGDVFVKYVELNERFHAQLVALAGSPVIGQAIDRVELLPFASPTAFLFAQSEAPEAREILLIGQNHHRTLVEAIANGEGTRAESVAREHARLARRNLQLALGRRELLDRVPGGALIRLVEPDPDGDGGGHRSQRLAVARRNRPRPA
jgi:GntR family transcriptional regulator of vanillate catabolism